MKRFTWLLVVAVLASAQIADAVSLNGRGQVAQGVGGGVAAVDDHVIATNAGGTTFVDDDNVVFQVCDGLCRLAVYNLPTRTTHTVAPTGANFITAGGGAWAAWLGGLGVYTSDSRNFVEAGLGPMGPDAALAIKVAYYSYGPWDVIERDGSRWRLTDGDAYDIQLLGAGRALWHEAGALRVRGLSVPVTLPGVVWWPHVVFVDGSPWLLYQSESAGGRLVLHPFGSLVGYDVTNGGDSFRPAAVQLANGRVRVAYATRESEAPGEVVVIDIDPHTAPRGDLTRFLAAPAPPPVTPPAPPVTPPPTPEPASLLADVIAARAGYPARNLTPAQLADLLNRVAWQHREQGWGLLAKPGGNNCPSPSGVAVSCDILFHKPSGLHYDVLGDAEGAAVPGWTPDGPMDVSRWVAPVAPSSSGSTPPPLPPPPVDDPRVAQLQAALDAERAARGNAERRVADLEQERDALKADRDRLIDERDAARAALAAQLAKPAPSCEAKVPPQLKMLGIRVGCRVIQ